MTSLRENAEDRLFQTGGLDYPGITNALKAIAWAILDLAEAIRESKKGE